jgi:hypothetical protein
MSFFEPPAPRPEPELPPQHAWVRSPDNELGVSVPVRAILVRTPSLVVIVDHVIAYTTGFTFRLAGRARAGAALDPQSFERLHSPHPRHMDQLLIGIQFADGRKATNINRRPPEDGDPGPVLMGGGGSSGGGRFDFEYWIWPLPPEGALTFVIQWTEEGIGLTRVELESSPIFTAGNLSEPLWPGVGGDAGSTTRTTSPTS